MHWLVIDPRLVAGGVESEEDCCFRYCHREISGLYNATSIILALGDAFGSIGRTAMFHCAC